MHAFPLLVSPYGDKYLFTTLFLFMNHMVKVIFFTTLSLFDKDHLMFCKSESLMFIFAENSYLVKQCICPHHVE